MHMGTIAATPTGAAALFTHSAFIDAILLSLSENPEDRAYVDKFLDAYSYIAKQQQAPDELITYYINCIYKITESGLTVKSKEVLANFALRMAADATQYPILKDVSDQITRLSNDAYSSTLVSVVIGDSRRRVCNAIQANIFLKDNMRQRSLIMTYGETGRDSDLLQIDQLAQNISASILNTRRAATAVTTIDTRDPDSLLSAFNRVEEKFTGKIFKTGLRALNNFMGSAKGMLLGTTILFGARSHNFKSGMLNKVPVWAIRYNDPPPTQDGTQLCVAIISLENEADVTIRDICDDLYIDIYREPVPKDWTNAQKTHFIIEESAKKNIVLRVERFQPHLFGVDEFVSYCEGLKASGLTIWAIALDYLAKMRVNPTMRINEALAENASRICNYTKANDFILFSGHQLNREATNAIMMRSNQAKYFNEGMMADSSGIFREVDNVFFLNIENNEKGIACLGMKWNKARYIKDVHELHKYAALPFLGRELGLVNDNLDDEPLYAHDVNNIVYPNWFIEKFPDYSFGGAGAQSMTMDTMAML